MRDETTTVAEELEGVGAPPEIIPGWIEFIDVGSAAVKAVANNYTAGGQEYDTWWHSGASDLPLNTELMTGFNAPLPKLGNFSQFNHNITSFAYAKADVPAGGTGVFVKVSSPDLSVVYMVKHRSSDNLTENWWSPAGNAFKANGLHFKITTTDRAGVLALLEPGGVLAAAPRRKHSITSL